MKVRARAKAERNGVLVLNASLQYSALPLIVRKLALMRQRQSQILQSQTGIDRNDPQRLRARIKVLVPLEYWNRENVQRVEFVLLVRDDNLDRKSTRLNSSHRCISYAVI